MGGVIYYKDLRKKCVNKKTESKSCNVRIIVQLSKCSVAVGADDVLKEIQQTIRDENLTDIIVEITGCMGLCHAEPIVIVQCNNYDEVVYSLVTPAKARVITIAHGIYGKKVEPWIGL